MSDGHKGDVGAGGATGGTIASESTAQQQLLLRQEQQRAAVLQGHTTPFAIIDEVSSNSPASEAGIQENDIPLQFRNVNSTNHDNCKAIAELLPMAASTNVSITVVLQRKTTKLGGGAQN